MSLILNWVASWLGFSANAKKPAAPEAEAITTPLREHPGNKCAQDSDLPEATITPELPNLRFMVQGGQVVGVINTVRRYQEHRPVKLHCTPFEKRVDDIMLQEKEVVPIQHLDLGKVA